jgi:hypothetical protein
LFVIILVTAQTERRYEMLKNQLIGILLAFNLHILGADATSRTAIGFVRASGEFLIDGSETRDNSTVFHGSLITTTRTTSHVVLEDGTRIDMGFDSRSRIYRDHLAIEQGLVRVQRLLHVNASDRYAILAGGIRIDSPEQTLVRVTDHRTVVVTTLRGVADIRNAGGIPVAMLAEGRTLEFSDSDTPPDLAHLAGCLARLETKSGNGTAVHYFLEDQTTNVVAELVGAGLEGLANYTVEVTGSIDPNIKATAPGAYVIRIGNITSSSQKKCTSPLGAASRSVPPAAVGIPPIGAIAGGVAVAGTLGGLALAGVIGGGASQTSPSPASR